MMSHEDHQPDHHLAAQLSSADKHTTPPDRAFLDRLREQTREAFIAAAEPGPKPRSRSRALQSPTIKWLVPVAAAAGLTLVAFGPRPWGSQNGIAWADVVRQMESVETLVWSATERRVTRSGGETVKRSKVYLKDPGKCRIEYLRPPSTQPATSAPTVGIRQVTILAEYSDHMTQIRLDPVRRSARVTTHVPRGSQRVGAAAYWGRLSKIAADKTRSIGERTIDGIRTIGFEAPVEELLSVPHAEGTVHVWVNRVSARPILVEAEMSDEYCSLWTYAFRDLKLNAPLPDSLFDVPQEQGWTTRRTEVAHHKLTKTALKPNVRVRVGLKDHPPIITEDGIDAITSIVTTSEKARDLTRVEALVDLAPAATKALRGLTAAHIGESLVLDFNGEAIVEKRIVSQFGHIILDISALGVSPEQFEQTYLVDSD